MNAGVAKIGSSMSMKAGAQWEPLAVIDMDEPIFASPAFIDNRMYLRTRGALYCFQAN